MEGVFREDHSIVLFDLITKEGYDLAEISQITLSENWKKLPLYPLKVIAGTPDYVAFTVDEILAQLPEAFALHQNYPNPFNPVTTIRYDLPRPERVTLKVYNIMGQEVVTLADGWKVIGRHEAIWNGKDRFGHPVSSGVYFSTLKVSNRVLSRKMVLMR